MGEVLGIFSVPVLIGASVIYFLVKDTDVVLRIKFLSSMDELEKIRARFVFMEVEHLSGLSFKILSS